MTEPLASGAYTIDPHAADPPSTAATVWAEGCTILRVDVGQVELHLERAATIQQFTGVANSSLRPEGTSEIYVRVFAIEDTTDLVKTVWCTDDFGDPVDWPFRFILRRHGAGPCRSC